MTSPTISIGIHVHASPEQFRDTLECLRANTLLPYELIALPDGPDPATRTVLDSLAPIPQSGTDIPCGAAACFNRLASFSKSDVIVLLESGSLVGPQWLDHLLAALYSNSHHGLAGPSTNNSWNEQCIRRYPFASRIPLNQVRTRTDVDTIAKAVEEHFSSETRSLEPLHSLADFCYAVRREVVEAIGAADEGYSLGPCWEMDYNIRAARAGLFGAWACGAYVHRTALSARRVHEEARHFESSCHRYQDKFCGVRLAGTLLEYKPHCRGDACEQFAPRELIQIKLSFPTATAPVPIVKPSVASSRVRNSPLVSCVMATRNRRDFVLQSIQYFSRQNYATKELLILDDDTQDLSSEIGCDPRIRYFQLPPGMSIGAKRNRGCELARGSIIAQWDDDDWYAENRLNVQIEPIAAGRADISALNSEVFLDLSGWKFWRCSPELHRRMFVGDVHGGTLVFRRSLYEQGTRYPHRSLAEDAFFLQQALRRGARLEKLPGADLFIYLRHNASSWRFACGEFIDRGGWQPIEEPVCLGVDREFYLSRFNGRASAISSTSLPGGGGVAARSRIS
jgi:glycosyltransferase involved in cell wall biosynthesis